MPFKFADIPGVFQERKPPVPIDFSGLHQWAQNQQANKRQAEELKFAREQEQRIRDEAAATRALQTRIHEDDLQLKMTDYFAQMEAEQHKRRIAQEKALNDATADALQAGWGRNYDVIETQIAERVRQAGGQLRWINDDGKATPIEQPKPAAPALPGDVPMPAAPTEKPAPKLTQPMTPEQKATAAQLDAIDTTMPGAPAPPALPGDVPMPQEPTEKPAPSELKKATKELSETVMETQQRMGPNSSVSISTTVKPEEKGPSKAVEVGGQDDPRDNARLELVRPDGSVVTLYSPEIRREQHRQAFDEFVADGEQGLTKPGDKADWQAAWAATRSSGRPYQQMVDDHAKAFQNFQKWRYGLEGARLSAAGRAQAANAQAGRYEENAWDKGKSAFGTRVPKVRVAIENYEAARHLVDLLSDPHMTRTRLATAQGQMVRAAGHGAAQSEGEQERILGKDSLWMKVTDLAQRNLNPDDPVPDSLRLPMLSLAEQRLRDRAVDVKAEYEGSVRSYFDAQRSRPRGEAWSEGYKNGVLEQFSQVFSPSGEPLFNADDFETPINPRQIQGSAAAATDPSQEDPEFNEFLQGSGN